MIYKVNTGKEIFYIDAKSPEAAYDKAERVYDDEHGPGTFYHITVGVKVVRADVLVDETTTLIRGFCVALEKPRPSDWERIVGHLLVDSLKFRGCDVIRVMPINNKELPNA
jgi:hypothetical protein